MTVGDKIKAIRKERKLTQQELSEIIGLSRNYISELENNKRNLSNDTLTNLANKLGVSKSYLLGESAQDNQSAKNEQKNWEKILDIGQYYLAECRNVDQQVDYQEKYLNLIETCQSIISTIYSSLGKVDSYTQDLFATYQETLNHMYEKESLQAKDHHLIDTQLLIEQIQLAQEELDRIQNQA
ncbi:helix-turn-helix domain-containing protein [Hutsoniella sourekii]